MHALHSCVEESVDECANNPETRHSLPYDRTLHIRLSGVKKEKSTERARGKPECDPGDLDVFAGRRRTGIDSISNIEATESPTRVRLSGSIRQRGGRSRHTRHGLRFLLRTRRLFRGINEDRDMNYRGARSIFDASGRLCERDPRGRRERSPRRKFLRDTSSKYIYNLRIFL